MSKAEFWQRGETIDYVNPTSTIIEANTIIGLGSRIGVAGTNIPPQETGSVHVTGVWEIKKTDANAVALGSEVFFDGEGITATSGSGTLPAGYAIQAAPAGAKTVLVKLLG